MSLVFSYNLLDRPTPLPSIPFEFGNWLNGIYITTSDHYAGAMVEANLVPRKGYNGNILLDLQNRTKIISLQWYITATDEVTLYAKWTEFKRAMNKTQSYWTGLPILTINENGFIVKYRAYVSNFDQIATRWPAEINKLNFNIQFTVPDGFGDWDQRTKRFNGLTSWLSFFTDVEFPNDESTADKQPVIRINFIDAYNWNLTLNFQNDIIDDTLTLNGLNMLAGQNVTINLKMGEIVALKQDSLLNKIAEIDPTGTFPYWFIANKTTQVNLSFSATHNVNVFVSFVERYH